ncbi:MAG: DMT family transporter [Treponema sp.]
MSKLTKDEVISRAALFVASVFWGTTFVIISSTNDYFRPAFLVFMRCAIGSFVLVLFFIKRLRRLTRRYFFISGALGLLMTLGYLLQGIAITNAGCPPGRCGFLVATYCVLTPFVAWVLDKKKPDAYNIIAAVLCLTGVVFISLPDLLQDADVAVNVGDLLALASSLIFALYLVYVGRYINVLDPMLFTIGNLFFGGVYAGIYTYFFEDNSGTVWNMHSIFSVLYLAVICMAITNVLQAVGQRHAPPSTTALIFSLESVFGIIFAITFWHEEVTPMLLLGCLFIFIAIVVSETKFGFLKKKLSSRVFKKFLS